MSKTMIMSLLLWSFSVVSSQRPTEDLITNLPSVNFSTNYSQYSGFLDLNNSHHYHYWLTESLNDPDKDPLVLWLNGGPGCSSLYGLFYENGPIHIDIDGTLYDNTAYSWNHNANIIYLESPICVGFSYADTTINNKTKLQKPCNVNDTTVADDNYHAILKFLDKFPIYKQSDFFVIGESYGGIYVPMLTRRILQGNANMDNEHNINVNIKGFSVGNGVSTHIDIANSRRWFQYFHGMISEETWSNMLINCCQSPYDRHSCNMINSTNTTCQYYIKQAQRNCCNDINPYNILDECVYPKYKTAYPMLKQEIIFNKFDDLSVNAIDNTSCAGDAWGCNVYLNRKDVREAIHVNRSILSYSMWDQCATLGPTDLNYTYNISTEDLTNVYNDIFKLDKNIIFTMYNGDLDMVCNFLGDEWFVDDMNLTVINEWREWFIIDNMHDTGKQVGGWTKDWDRGNDNVHFVTVRGSGHMVPLYKPQAALKLFQYFLINKQLD
eukprot:368407_1